MAQFANFFLKCIKAWQAYSQLRGSILLDCSQWKERIFIEVPMGMDDIRSLSDNIGGSGFRLNIFHHGYCH